MPKSRFIAMAALLLCLAIPSRHAIAQTAVIVHRSSAVNDVKLDELRRFFLGQGALAANGQQVVLAELTPLRTRFYKRLLGLTPDEVRRRWIGMVFRGDALALPFEVADAAAAKKFVADHPGAVAFLDVSDLDDTVKALKIDGKRPNEPLYPLK